MKKSELKTGMIVETRSRKKYIVLTGCNTTSYNKQEFCLIREGEMVVGHNYAPNLFHHHRQENDIMKVWCNIVDHDTYMMDGISDENLIWERKEEKEEIEKVAITWTNDLD